MHNIYVPVSSTIMPRPKFRDFNKEDQEGKDFTYRNVDQHSVQPGITRQESLKPSPFSPALPSRDLTQNTKYSMKQAKMRWNMPYRLNRNKRTKHFVISTPVTWKFSTYIGGTTMSEADEEKAIQEYNQINIKESQNMFSKLYTYAKVWAKNE